VGVPCFIKCVLGPSFLILWPILIFLKIGIPSINKKVVKEKLIIKP
jgi:hypothetical protein